VFVGLSAETSMTDTNRSILQNLGNIVWAGFPILIFFNIVIKTCGHSLPVMVPDAS
jgi:hypothetical protein